MNLGGEWVLGGRYVLRAPLGSGGQGSVWRALDRVLGRDVAVKLMLNRDLDAVLRERFRREAGLPASLRHPGIIEVYDYGHHDGQPFIVMELLTGRDLYRMMLDNPRGLPVARAADLAAQAAEALACLHGNGVLHRDIKPANLFVQAGGQLKVCDFGVAKNLAATAITIAGDRLGTYAYLAPEVWLGDPATSRSDLYSLGCVLYQMLTGEPPFAVEQPEDVLRQNHLQDDPRPPHGEHLIPERLARLAGQLLRKDPLARPASAEEVAQELRAIAVVPSAAWLPGDLLTRSDAPARGPGTRPGPTILPTPALPPAYYAAPAAPAPVVGPAPVDGPAPGPCPPSGPGAAPANGAVAAREPAPPARSAGPGLRWWTRAVRASAWVVFLTTAAVCAGVAAGGWAPMSRLFVLGPAAAYTLAGAVAVSRAALARERLAALAFASFWVAEAAAILAASRTGPPQAWAVVLILSWLGGLRACGLPESTANTASRR